MDKEKVLNLAKMARIELKEEEVESLSHEFEAILNYVGDVKNADTTSLTLGDQREALINVMREDTGSHEPSLYTQKLLAQAPSREGDYLKVKKIL
jgi:aspartyl-tRNA(Asn)/glutamyl-tRNA(Gln) amidotransferase subunit C